VKPEGEATNDAARFGKPIALSQQPRLVDDAASNARSRIMMSSGQQRESLAAKLLGAQKSDTEEANGSTDLLIRDS
jgi:hypothetical protein